MLDPLGGSNSIRGESRSSSDVLICCIFTGRPREVRTNLENRRLSPRERVWLRRQERDRESGQLSLLDMLGQKTVESESQPVPEDIRRRDPPISQSCRDESKIPGYNSLHHSFGKRVFAVSRTPQLVLGISLVALFYKSRRDPMAHSAWGRDYVLRGDYLPPSADDSCRHVAHSSLAQGSQPTEMASPYAAMQRLVG